MVSDMERNGNGKRKLKRNGNGKPDNNVKDEVFGEIEQEKLMMYKGKARLLTKGQLSILESEDKRLVRWLDDLRKQNAFSREWILSCLTELSLQCMGKIPHAFGSVHTTTFLPKAATSSLKLMAEIQGFNVFKVDARLGVLTAYDANVVVDKPMGLEDNAPKQIELVETDEITAEVAEILSKASAFEPQAQQVTEAEVVEVHTP